MNDEKKNPWSNGRTDVGLNKLVKPECLYCKKYYSNMGQVRPHLRLHYGLRPYKCAECEYKHWEKNTMMTNHFVLTHGRKGNIEDIKTNFEEEKALEDKVEEDVLEIRENQRRKNRGEPVGEKKMPPRDIGQVFHEHRTSRTNYRAAWDVGSDKPAENNNSPDKETQNKQPQLASKLSQAFNQNQKNGQGYPTANTNNAPRPSSPKHGLVNADIPLDQLLNNDF